MRVLFIILRCLWGTISLLKMISWSVHLSFSKSEGRVCLVEPKFVLNMTTMEGLRTVEQNARIGARICGLPQHFPVGLSSPKYIYS